MVKVIGVLGTPFVFAMLLNLLVSLIFATPFLIALIIVLSVSGGCGSRHNRDDLYDSAWVVHGGSQRAAAAGNMSPFYDYSALILTLNTQLQQMW